MVEESKLIIELLQRITKTETKVDSFKEKIDCMIESDDKFKARYYKFEIDVLRKLDSIDTKLATVNKNNCNGSFRLPLKYKIAILVACISFIGVILSKVIEVIPLILG